MPAAGVGRGRAGRKNSAVNSTLTVLFNRDLVQGRTLQCRARAAQLWARLCCDPVREARLGAEYLRGSVQARYGRHRALAEWRLRRIERV